VLPTLPSQDFRFRIFRRCSPACARARGGAFRGQRAVTVDVAETLARADLQALALVHTELRRVGRELHGPCPFCTCAATSPRHQCDRFRLDAERRHWFCRHCTPRGGNAIDLAMRAFNVDFQRGCFIAAGGIHALVPRERPVRSAGPPQPSRTWRTRAQQFVAEAVRTLWTTSGDRARAYLAGRGLRHDTLEAWSIGVVPADTRSPADEWGLERDALFVPRGIVVPWHTTAGEVVGIKIRRPVPATARHKYASISGSSFRLFGAQTIIPGEPLILTEGELDAVSAWQAIGDRAATVALGTARQPDTAEFRLLSLASPVLVALDADDVGDRAADQVISLSENCRRARPPDAKDLSACVEHGTDLSAWFRAALDQA